MSRLLILAALAAAAGSTLSAQAEDRYGSPPSAAQAAAPAPVALLSWPGKATAPAVEANDSLQTASPTSAYAPPPADDRSDRFRGVILAAPADSVQSAPPAPSAPVPPPMATAAPTPLAPPSPPMAATPPPGRIADTSSVAHSAQAPRFYSVARQYGVKPDPDPLPAQFFADNVSGDMAAPPPPLDPHPVPGTQAATSPANSADNRARQTAIDTTDAGADGPPGAPAVN